MSNRNRIIEFEKKHSIIIPDIYVNFLLGFSSREFDKVTLFSLEELCDAYDYMLLKKYAPNFLPIGRDGGGNIMVMKQKKDATVVYSVSAGCIGYIETYFDEKFEDFHEWFLGGCELTDDEEDYFVDIVLIKSPENIKDNLLEFKEHFRMEISTVQLFSMLKNPPCVLSSHIYQCVAKTLIEKFDQTDIFECIRSEEQ